MKIPDSIFDENKIKSYQTTAKISFQVRCLIFRFCVKIAHFSQTFNFVCVENKHILGYLYAELKKKILYKNFIRKMLSKTIYQAFSTHTKFCIVGGGSGGLNFGCHLLRNNSVQPKDIRYFEPSQYHYYQPGWTMVGNNLAPSGLTVRKMVDVLPHNCFLTKQGVSKIQPQNNTIVCADGEKFTYEHLIISTGLKYNWEKIKGAKQALEDPKSNVGSIYQLKYAQKLGRIGQKFKGGRAIFHEPAPPIKCAGAPQKILYLWTDTWQKQRIPCEVQYIKYGGVMFGVPKYSQALTKIAKDYGIKSTFNQNLVQINDDTAIFQNVQTKQRMQKKFNFCHIVPPMSAHSFIAESGLADATGFMDVNKFTLRSTKHKNIWGIGDCTNTPNSKTAAAIFSQTTVLVNNILAVMQNPALEKLADQYQGYASCPLFVGKGKLMLAQFKYGGEIDQTFLTTQQRPRRFFYFMKRYMFPHIYWHLVPRGLWGGRRGLKIDI